MNNNYKVSKRKRSVFSRKKNPITVLLIFLALKMYASAINTAPPTANFTYDNSEPYRYKLIQFTDTSLDSPTSWYWQFGDDGISHEQNPVHSYNNTGTYTITLEVTNECGESDIKTEIIAITDLPVNGSLPVANFTADTTSSNVTQPIAFHNTSTNMEYSDTVANWSWDFGNGNTSTLKNPTHTFDAIGTYTVTLTATNPYGNNVITRTNYITIEDAPTANFTSPTSSFTNQIVSFTDTSTHTPTSFLWDFGDGTTSTLQNPTHTYANNGVYTVILKASNAFGTSTKIMNMSVIHESTMNDIDGNNYPTITLGNQVWMTENLRVTKQNDGTNIANVSSNSDWNNLTDSDIAYSFFNNDDTSIFGAYYTFEAARNVCPTGWKLPNDEDWSLLATYLANNGYNYDESIGFNTSGLEFNKIGKSLADTSNWNTSTNQGAVGNDLNANNSTGFKALPSYRRLFDGTFLANNFSGTYSVWWSNSLIGTSASSFQLYFENPNLGKTAYSKTNGICVRCVKDYKADFSVSERIEETNEAISFTDESTGTPTNWLWDFGDGTTSTLQNPTHSYANKGLYTISLKVSNDFGIMEEVKTDYIEIIDPINYDDTVTDLDGNTYNTITIGSQTWMAENLKVSQTNTGIAIPTNWENLDNTDLAYEPSSVYGAYYTYATALMVCPNGWRLPSDNDWTTLENYLADNGYNYDCSIGGGRAKIAKSLASKSVKWITYFDDGNGMITPISTSGAIGNDLSKNNESRFSGLPSTYRGDVNEGVYAIWWTSTGYNDNQAYQRQLNVDFPQVYRYTFPKSRGLCVRCVKDATLSVDETIIEDALATVYPNPTSNILNVEVNRLNTIRQVAIYDITGKLIKVKTHNTNIVDIKDIDTGIYLLKIKTDKGVLTKKIIKQ